MHLQSAIIHSTSSPLSCLFYVLSFPPIFALSTSKDNDDGHCKLLSMRTRINLITKMCTLMTDRPRDADCSAMKRDALGIGGGEKGIIIEMFRHIAFQLTWGRDFQSPFYTFFHPTNCSNTIIYFYKTYTGRLQHWQFCIFFKLAMHVTGCLCKIECIYPLIIND